MATPKEAIPTLYRGVQMRSRAEADTARLLDLLRIPWEYESTSVVLRSGRHYRPDFVLPPTLAEYSLPKWLEVRGYYTDDGRQQIREIAQHVAFGQLPCRVFVCVTGDNEAGATAASYRPGYGGTFEAVCDWSWIIRICACGDAQPVPRAGHRDLCCGVCRGNEYTPLCVRIVDGYVSIGPEFYYGVAGVRVRDIDDDANVVAIVCALQRQQAELHG